MVIIGRVACQRRSIRRRSSFSGGGALYIPPGGNTLIPNLERTTYVSSINIIPAHQAGNALDVAENMEAMRSNLLPTRVANFTPNNRPNTAVIIVAVVTKSMVLGSRSPIRDVILLLPFEVLRVRASPKSSLITRPIIWGNRWYQGLLRP